MKDDNVEVIPYKGVGNIRLGALRSELRILYPNFKEFRKSSFDENTTDAYSDFHIYYDKHNYCEAIELFGSAKISFMKERLLGVTFAKIKDFFFGIDRDIEISDSGLTSYKFGIGIYVPSIKDESNLVEGVILFREGYYD